MAKRPRTLLKITVRREGYRASAIGSEGARHREEEATGGSIWARVKRQRRSASNQADAIGMGQERQGAERVKPLPEQEACGHRTRPATARRANALSAPSRKLQSGAKGIGLEPSSLRSEGRRHQDQTGGPSPVARIAKRSRALLENHIAMALEILNVQPLLHVCRDFDLGEIGKQ
jgi:hypothetical protein